MLKNTILFSAVLFVLIQTATYAVEIQYDDADILHEQIQTHNIGNFTSAALFTQAETYDFQKKELKQKIVAISLGIGSGSIFFPIDISIQGTESTDTISIPFHISSSGQYTINIELEYKIQMFDVQDSFFVGVAEEFFTSYVQTGIIETGSIPLKKIIKKQENLYLPTLKEKKWSFISQAFWNSIDAISIALSVGPPTSITALHEVSELLSDIASTEEVEGRATLTYTVNLDLNNSYEIYIDLINSCTAVSGWLGYDISELNSTIKIKDIKIVPEDISLPNNDPVLSRAKVTPICGPEGTEFEYTVYYWDPDLDVPTTKSVIIDGSEYQMSLKAGQPYNGIYSFTSEQEIGSHYFFYYFAECNGGSDMTPLYYEPIVFKEESTVSVDIVVAEGPATENISIEFQHGPDISNTQKYEWSPMELPKVIQDIPMPQVLGFCIILESGNHSIDGWTLRDDDGNIITEGSDWCKIVNFSSGNVHATAYSTYTPNEYSISGTVLRKDGSEVPEGVELVLESQVQQLSTQANNGEFTFSGVKGGVTVTISPSSAGYSFSPPKLIFNNLIENQTDMTLSAYSADIKAPTTTFTQVPDQVCEESSVTFSWTGSDDISSSQNLQYQYKLEGVDTDWLSLSSSTSVSYNLENGVYTFWVRAQDEALNLNQAPDSFTFIVNCDPKIVSYEKINSSVWASRVTIEAPVPSARLNSTFIILPVHSASSDSDLVPIKIFRANEDTALGVNEIYSQYSNKPLLIYKEKLGWRVTVPNEFEESGQLSYDILWGKVLYFGWQEFVDVPSGFPNSGDSVHSYLDNNLKLWKSSIKKIDHGGLGNSVEQDYYIYSSSCDQDGCMVEDKLIRYLQGIITDYYNDNLNKPRGIYYVLYPKGIIGSDDRIFYAFQEEKSIWDGSRSDRYFRYSLSIFNTSGTEIAVKEGPLYYQSNEIAFSDRLINEIFWIAGEQCTKDSNQEDIWTIGLNKNGTEIIPQTTIYSTTDKHVGALYIQPIGNNVLIIWAEYWETSLDRDRRQLAYVIVDKNGSIVKNKSYFHNPVSNDNDDFNDEYSIRLCMTDNEGKVWISYERHINQSGSSVYTQYYAILDQDGNMYKGPVQTYGGQPREFHYCDYDGYIWTTESNQLFLLNSDDTVVVSPRSNVGIPDHSLGTLAADAQPNGYRIFDRWTNKNIPVFIPPNYNFNMMELYDLDLWENDLHPSNVEILKSDSSIWNQSGEFVNNTTIDVSNVLNSGNNLLTFSQDNLFGGQLLVTFSYNPDSDQDGISDAIDQCPETLFGCQVDEIGCSLDDDNDSVCNGVDQCPNTPVGCAVDAAGCSLDSDGDGVCNDIDQCPNTPTGCAVDADGCSLDDDGDGVCNGVDECPNTPLGCVADATGCSLDNDGDGVCNGVDQCPNTPVSCDADVVGCPLDSDGDGVCNGVDQCPNTPVGCAVDSAGCSLDSDGDGVCSSMDQCPDTPAGCGVDANGCHLDDDGDGVCNGVDLCSNTPVGCAVDADGCSLDDDGDGVCNGVDQCPDTPAGCQNKVNEEGCVPTPVNISYPDCDADGSFTVSWSSVGMGWNYTLMRADNPDFTSDILVYEGPLTTIDENALPENTYFYRIRTTDYCGDSAWTEGNAIQVPCGPQVTREGSCYLAGEPVQLCITIEYEGDMTALGVEETVPDDWTYVSTAGDDAPDVEPAGGVGATGTLGFGWVTPPDSPVDFCYSLDVPGDQQGEKTIAGIVRYRIGAGSEHVVSIPDTTLIDRCYHSADYNPADWTISLSELLRAIQLYNIGCYYCDTSGEDGFSLVSGNRLCKPHNLDYNTQDWCINLSELLRLIQLYNLGGYCVDPEGEDGFRAGSCD